MKQNVKYKGEIILAVLFLYVVALGIVTYDEVFRKPPHLFPPPLEKEVINAVKQFRTEDPAAREKAQQTVLDIEDFVTVPVLIHYLTDKNLQMRETAADTLDKIAQRLGVERPPAFQADGPPSARAEGKRLWTQWMKKNNKKL